MTTIACGICVYYAMWHKFPPTASWVVIIPLWFLVLSTVRTFSGIRLRAIPPLYVSLPLVLAVFWFAPGAIGPPLGSWIPVCCVVGTVTGLSRWQPEKARKTLMLITAGVGVVLVGFGVRDYVTYRRMPEADKEKFLPVWEVTGVSAARHWAHSPGCKSRAHVVACLGACRDRHVASRSTQTSNRVTASTPEFMRR